MKTKNITVIVVIAFIAITVALTVPRTKAQGQERRVNIAAVVYISAIQTYSTSGYATDLVVEYASSSEGVLAVEFGTPIGKALAYYINQGFHIEPRPTFGEFLLVR